MSKATDDPVGRRQDCDAALRPHLSALVDGELEPIEAIALKQHLRQSATLEAEYRELERLKMAVHLAGTRDVAPATLGEQLEARCRASFAARRAKRAPRLMTWLVPIGSMAAVALALVVVTGGEPATDGGEAVPQVAVLPADPSDVVMARLVDFHREQSSPMVLADLSANGALVTIERLPDTFIVPEGQRPTLVQASYMGCNEREGGSTLAVLRVDRVDLPQRVDNALDATGVYVDTIDGVEVRMSVSGDKLFVLLSGEASGQSTSPI